MKVEVFERPKQIAEYLSVLIRKLTDKSDISISLSGGSTPEKIYSHLADIQPPISWNKINLYWGDERMVPPDDPVQNLCLLYFFLAVSDCYRADLEPALQTPVQTISKLSCSR